MNGFMRLGFDPYLGWWALIVLGIFALLLWGLYAFKGGRAWLIPNPCLQRHCKPLMTHETGSRWTLSA